MSFKKKTFKKMAHKNKRQYMNQQYQPQRNSNKKNATFQKKNPSLLGRIKRTYPSNGSTTNTRKPKKFPRVNPKSIGFNSQKQKRNNTGTQTISFKAGQSTGMRLDGVKVTHIDTNKQAAKRGVKIGWIVKEISGHNVDAKSIRQILAQVGKTNNLVFKFEKPSKRRKMVLAKDLKKKNSKNVDRIDDSQTLERVTNVEDVGRVTDPKDVDILIKEFEEQFGEELRPFHQEQPPLNGQWEKVDAFLEYMETFIKREMRVCGLA